jgi:perosamine synthetase
MIRLIKPYITFEEIKNEFESIFETGWFSKGRYLTEFSESLKSYIGCKHAFLTTSATTALSIALKVLQIKAGDEVIVSDFSFPATVNIIEDLGATPVFADVDLNTFNMLETELSDKITPNTKAVIFVDTFGNPSGIHTIKDICKKYKLPLIEDAACAIGSSVNGTKCGKIADITCFSFHPRKLLTTGEGGAITTNNDNIAKSLSIKLNHGALPNDDELDFVDVGYNYRMSELQAVMGIKQLIKLDYIIESRNKTRNEYISHLSTLGFIPQKIISNNTYNVQSIVFRIPQNIKRSKLIAYLKSNGIETTIGTYCLSDLTYYKNKYNSVQKNSKHLAENSITFPCYDGIEIDHIIDCLSKFDVSG